MHCSFRKGFKQGCVLCNNHLYKFKVAKTKYVYKTKGMLRWPISSRKEHLQTYAQKTRTIIVRRNWYWSKRCGVFTVSHF
jgi:hypothetical protein